VGARSREQVARAVDFCAARLIRLTCRIWRKTAPSTPRTAGVRGAKRGEPAIAGSRPSGDRAAFAGRGRFVRRSRPLVAFAA
jgi:hypothetical protein